MIFYFGNFLKSTEIDQISEFECLDVFDGFTSKYGFLAITYAEKIKYKVYHYIFIFVSKKNYSFLFSSILLLNMNNKYSIITTQYYQKELLK